MMKRDVSGEGGAVFRTSVRLWPYIWPSDRSDLKRRVLWATILLFGAKLATMAVPFTF
jgi:ATP-binding cassette subfamily B protein